MPEPEDLPAEYEMDGVIVCERPGLTEPDRYHLVGEAQVDEPICETWLQHPEADWALYRLDEVPASAELCRACDPDHDHQSPGIDANRIRMRVKQGEDPLGGSS
jgi:hypothetical protein